MASSTAMSSLLCPGRVVITKGASCVGSSARLPSRVSLSSGKSLVASRCRASHEEAERSSSVSACTKRISGEEVPSLSKGWQLPAAASAAFLAQELAVSLPAQALEFPAIGILTSGEVEGLAYIIVAAGGYLFVAPPLIFNYLRLRWYKRSTLETIFQYYLFFLFFPAMLLWAPFINFRRFGRDPSKM